MEDGINEKESIYRCGWCGFPTDDKGQPLEMDNDAAYEYLEKHKDDINVSTNGHCCANEQHERDLHGE
jgi:hypothetical protein